MSKAYELQVRSELTCTPSGELARARDFVAAENARKAQPLTMFTEHCRQDLFNMSASSLGLLGEEIVYDDFIARGMDPRGPAPSRSSDIAFHACPKRYFADGTPVLQFSEVKTGRRRANGEVVFTDVKPTEH